MNHFNAFVPMNRVPVCRQAREHRKFAVAEGDHLTMLNVYEAFIKVTEPDLLVTQIHFHLNGTWFILGLSRFLD